MFVCLRLVWEYNPQAMQEREVDRTYVGEEREAGRKEVTEKSGSRKEASDTGEAGRKKAIQEMANRQEASY